MNLILKRLLAALPVALITFIFSYIPGAVPFFDAALLSVFTFIIVSLIFNLDRMVESLNGEVFMLVSGGILLGLVFGALFTDALSRMGFQAIGMNVAVYMVSMSFFGFGGMLFARFPGLRIFGGGGGAYVAEKEGVGTREKILDTSVIIDGRILDIAETNFIEGPFIIPNFVLREIQLISDSPDPVKRNRGRRGLDMLNKLQQNGSVPVKISYIDYSDTREVDAKLVKLSRETGAKLITNDFNLNKVAELQGVQVLNLNSLTNALKPVVLPGEEILIDVIKEGKDENQGIGYLEDGTMVVVENGRSLLNKTVRVSVTSIIQTAAGKMIFTRAAGVVEETGGGSPGGNMDEERQNKGGDRRRDGRRGNRSNRSRQPQNSGSDNYGNSQDDNRGNRR